MRPAKLAALLLAAAQAASAASISHFELGQRAFEQGRYETALHEMMQVLLSRPYDRRAQEYMRWAGEKLRSKQQRRSDEDLRGMMDDHQDALDRGRTQAATWKAWVQDADDSALAKQWALSYDAARRVLDENPAHSDAKAAADRARQGMARTLGDEKSSPRKKDRHLYHGLLYSIGGQSDRAREELGAALALEDSDSELGDERIKFYLVRAGGRVPRALPGETRVARARDEGEASEGEAEPSAARPLPPRRRKAAPKTLVPTPSQAPFAPVSQQTAKEAYEAGVQRASEERYGEAIELFARALVKEPGYPGAAEGLMQARQSLQDQTKKRKDEASALYQSGLLLYGQGELAQAVASWKRALELDPDNGFVQRALSHAEQELREKTR